MQKKSLAKIKVVSSQTNYRLLSKYLFFSLISEQGAKTFLREVSFLTLRPRVKVVEIGALLVTYRADKVKITKLDLGFPGRLALWISG